MGNENKMERVYTCKDANVQFYFIFIIYAYKITNKKLNNNI